MTATQNTPRPTRSKSNGQWAVDGKDPLNGNEVFKQADNALKAPAHHRHLLQAGLRLDPER